MWLIHGFADRSRDSERVSAQGRFSPSCRASQARTYCQSRLSVLTDAPSTLGGFFDGEPGVIAKLNDFPQPRVFRLKLLDRLIEGEQIAARRLDPGHSFGQLDAPSLAAVFKARLAAGLFDQNMTHRLRGRAEKMAPALPSRGPCPSPAGGTPRGPRLSAGGYGPGATRLSTTRPGGVAHHKEPATIPLPTACLLQGCLHLAAPWQVFHGSSACSIAFNSISA